MKRLRFSLWSNQLRLAQQELASSSVPRRRAFLSTTARCQSATTIEYEPSPLDSEGQPAQGLEDAVTVPATTTVPPLPAQRRPLPSPPPERALQSPKLAALHARLALPRSIPLQTLARTLVTASADPNSSFNNSSLALLGNTLVDHHVLEYLVCRWPRLPIAVVFATLRAFSGPEVLETIARRWGVDAAAAPGEEVDPGLLQWQPGPVLAPHSRWAYVRADGEHGTNFRRGMSSRIVLDDAYGNEIGPLAEKGNPERRGHNRPAGDDYAVAKMRSDAYASFVVAVVGSIYAHSGADAAKTFIKAHILSRTIELDRMFQFKLPTRELAMLCAREGFEPPRARLESETGRHSRTPVFIVGIYSGEEKLGEGVGASLDVARRVASMNALKAWYLYSPGDKVRVPTDMMQPDAKPWKAPYIDIGEII